MLSKQSGFPQLFMHPARRLYKQFVVEGIKLDLIIEFWLKKNILAFLEQNEEIANR